MEKLEFWKGNIQREVFTFTLFMRDVIPAMEQKLTKNVSSTTSMLCRNSFHCILKMSMSENLNGLETNLPLTNCRMYSIRSGTTIRKFVRRLQCKGWERRYSETNNRE
jgi:hypothetical protein